MSGDSLTEFILRRIAEDEAMAREATGGPWWYDPAKWNSVDHEESVFAGSRDLEAVTVASTGPGNDPQSMRDGAHIARHDPARVLAECEAKRRIVGMAIPSGWYEGRPVGSSYVDGWWDALGYLALPYADHPDYDESWRP